MALTYSNGHALRFFINIFLSSALKLGRMEKKKNRVVQVENVAYKLHLGESRYIIVLFERNTKYLEEGLHFSSF